MPQGGFILEGTRANFHELVLANSRRGLVVVDFWSPRAGPSLRQRELLRRLAEEYAGRFLLVTVNTDQEGRLAGDYGVRSLPSLKLFRHGRVVEEVRGMQTEADYRPLVDKHLGSAATGIKAEALAAWQAGKPDQAIQLLAEGAMAAPEDLELPATLAKLLMRLDRGEEALAVLDALPQEARTEPEIRRLRGHLSFVLTAAKSSARGELEQTLAESPDDCSTRYRLAAACLVEDDYENALEQLLEILRREPEFGQGKAKDGILALLQLLEDRPELVQRYRNELFRLSH
jgi:putative thioredoxin